MLPKRLLNKAAFLFCHLPKLPWVLIANSLMQSLIKILSLLSFSFFTIVLSPINLSAQSETQYNKAFLDTLNAIANGGTISSHFAKLYYNTILATNEFAKDQPETVKQFVLGLDSVFIPIFFEAHKQFIEAKSIPKNWQPYYQYQNLNVLQYQFMGMNAHINGDLHLALIEKFSYDTIKKYQKDLLSFQKVLSRIVDSVYSSTQQIKNLRTFHILTLGTDKMLARKMVWHWRLRQVRLALLFYKDPVAYQKKRKRVEKQMHYWNQRVLHYFK